MTQIGLPDDQSHRWYFYPGDPEADGYDSVSAVLDATDPNSWGAAWGAKMAAQVAIAHAPTVELVREELGDEAAVKLITVEAQRRRQIKRDMGTYQHSVLEALLAIQAGRDHPLPEVPPHLQGVELDGERVDLDAISDGLLNFLTQWGISADHILLSEATIANDQYGYAGTLDLGLWLPGFVPPGHEEPPSEYRGERGTVALIDAKTGRVKRRAFAQLAAYRRCPVVWLDWLGNTTLTPDWDVTAVLHIDPRYRDGYNLVLMPEDDQAAFERFLRLQAELHDAEREEKIRFRPIYPPRPDGSQPPPRLEHLPAGYGKVTGPLVKADVHDLGRVADLTEAELLGIKGIGPKGVEVIVGVLAQYGLRLREAADDSARAG